MTNLMFWSDSFVTKPKKILSPKQPLGLHCSEIIFFFCFQSRTNRYSLWQEHIQILPCLNIPLSGFTVHQRKYSAYIAGTMTELPPLIVQLEKRNYFP